MDYRTWARVRSSYDEVAASYDERFADELSGKPRDRELLDAFAAAADGIVAEIGCGPGQIGARVRANGCRVIGVDLSAAMAARATRRLDGAVVADMRALPLARSSAGAVLAFYSIIHVPRSDLGDVLREFARVLRPGGRILLSAHEGTGVTEVDEFVGHRVPMIATLFHLDELTAACTRAGLRVVKAERRDPYPTESQRVRLYVESELAIPRA